jgi:type I restriction-modification system DNA methylase subunit
VFPEGFFNDFIEEASSFTDILPDKTATYQLFAYLNQKFNGDLFPVSLLEKENITKDHLDELRLFLIGQARLADRQLRFWKFYSFDVIPIEFISSIYEEFYHISEKENANGKPPKTGTYYTPHHLVELLVDEVFPWEGKQTNHKTLDPACGSGIFLVEIYRRLIARWEQANPEQHLSFEQLAQLLTDNIFGVDLDQSAVHVAAFSLYLTLCDFLEPRQIWDEVSFPPLRHKNLFSVDFFKEQQEFTAQSYDLIIGNPPWKSELTEAAKQYCLNRQAEFPDRQFSPDKQIALTFLWRAAELCEPNGEICLLVPSKGLLFNRSSTHTDFRRDFFTTYHVKTIINLSAYRHILFDKAVGAGTGIIYTTQQPNEDVPILYCSPKPSHSVDDNWQFRIEPQDIAELPRDEATQNDIIWKTAMWGGPRDYELVKKLMSSTHQTLEALCENRHPKWVHGEGIIVGKEKKQVYDATHLLGKPYFDIQDQELDRFVVDEDKLPTFDKIKIERPRPKKKDIFEGPHILIKQSPKTGEQSFRAALLKKDTVFRNSFVGIHGSMEDIDLLSQCCVVLNSRVPLYYALMSSGRWLIERDELNKEEIMSFPVPSGLSDESFSYEDLRQLANDDDWENKIKNKIEELYTLTEDELILINDTINYTLDYFRLKEKSQAADPTFDEIEGEQHLIQYIQIAQSTLQNSFGKLFRAIIFQGADSPLRVIGLDWMPDSNNYHDEIILENSRAALEDALKNINQYLTEQRSPGVFIQRNVRAYVGNMIYIIKPDQKRYWTRSSALRDADEIYADVMASREL